MKSKLIIAKANKPTIVDLDAICEESIPKAPEYSRSRGKSLRKLRDLSSQKLFSLILNDYISSKAKELYLYPKSKHSCSYNLIMEDGSMQKRIPPPNFPPFFIHDWLRGFNEWRFMNYDPYSDCEQFNVIEARYKGESYPVEICVKPSRYGRGIVLRKPTDMEKLVKRMMIDSLKKFTETIEMVEKRLEELENKK